MKTVDELLGWVKEAERLDPKKEHLLYSILRTKRDAAEWGVDIPLQPTATEGYLYDPERGPRGLAGLANITILAAAQKEHIQTILGATGFVPQDAAAFEYLHREYGVMLLLRGYGGKRLLIQEGLPALKTTPTTRDVFGKSLFVDLDPEEYARGKEFAAQSIMTIPDAIHEQYLTPGSADMHRLVRDTANYHRAIPSLLEELMRQEIKHAVCGKDGTTVMHW